MTNDTKSCYLKAIMNLSELIAAVQSPEDVITFCKTLTLTLSQGGGQKNTKNMSFLTLKKKVPYRLLVFELMTNVQVCLLCGSSPSLIKLESEIGRFWKPAFESLKSLSQIYPRNFPLSTVIDQNILGFLLVNNETHRCLSTIFPKQDDGQNKGNLPQKERFEILRSFYKHTIGTYFASTIEASDREPSKLSHTPMETYITSDTHKCYALQSGPHHFFVLYNANIPTFAMRNVTHKTLASLLKDKFIQV